MPVPLHVRVPLAAPVPTTLLTKFTIGVPATRQIGETGAMLKDN